MNQNGSKLLVFLGALITAIAFSTSIYFVVLNISNNTRKIKAKNEKIKTEKAAKHYRSQPGIYYIPADGDTVLTTNGKPFSYSNFKSPVTITVNPEGLNEWEPFYDDGIGETPLSLGVASEILSFRVKGTPGKRFQLSYKKR